jgi:Ni/Co efflux regulator RcnB
MFKKSVASITLAVMLATSGSVFAQGNGRNNRQNENGCQSGQANCGGQDNRQRANQNDRGQGQQQSDRNRGNQRHSGERGAGPDQSFYRGERLPSAYRSRQYVVDDWRGHHLSAPPRGYHWVQTGGDYVLVAIATGVILQLLLNN